MKRYENFVLEAEKGITFEDSKGTSGELITRDPTANVYSKNYANPPIPEGYKHICGQWNNGFVIERCSDRSQLVWIPVGSLDSNGTLDGEHFSEKLGRRYMKYELPNNTFREALNDELLKQLESVKKYGGFYISRYYIFKSSEGKPQSIKGVMPWVNINFNYAKKVASTFEDNEVVKSHLIYGAEYDSVWEWLIKTGVRNRVEESDEWMNNWDTKNSPLKVVKTGSKKEWYANNIYSFAFSLNEWTQEWYFNWGRVVRSGIRFTWGNWFRFAERDYHDPLYWSEFTGFRVALYIK